ncbi:MAG: hypothetical protein OQK03_00505, partial [Colwellia sp.]|nr:hypothetical protein [Colwellia sp.]
KFDIKLVFPKSEPHFDVIKLKQLLEHKQKVSIVQTDYLHGFMNQYSKNYNAIGYDEHVMLLQQAALSARQ